MAVYEYTAREENGTVFCGTDTEAGSVGGLRDELAKMGDTLIKVRKLKTASDKFVRISQVDVVTFVYKLAGMCSAGLSIIASLQTLEEQTDNNSLRLIISDIKQNLEAGSSLKDAFGKHRKIFSDFLIGMLEAGESSGKLSQTLTASAAYMEKQLELRRKVVSAFAYPAVVGVMCIVIVIALLLFVIPVFSNIYRQMHVALPGPTYFLIVLSVIIKQFWWIVLPVIAVFIFSLRKLAKNKQAKKKWDCLKLKLPLFGQLAQKIVVSRFIRTFAILVSAGVSLVKSFEVASLVADNSEISEITADLQKSIEAGCPVADSLKKHAIFPPIIIQLAASGEEAGLLADMLNKGVDFLDKDIDRSISSLLVKLEPAMTVIMGTIVGFILLSVYLPMFDYMSHLK